MIKLSGASRILGIFGDPVAHSLSPVMQNEALGRAGIDAVYVPFHVRPENLARAVVALRALDIWGVNITVPHKENVVPYLDEIDAGAQRIGAVNTIVNRGGNLVGYNTDGVGLLRSLEEDLGFVPQGKRVLLLGAGGACRAALASLAQAGASWIGVANRTRSRAVELTQRFAEGNAGTRLAAFGLDAGELSPILPRVDLVINTSAVGLKGEAFETFPWQALPTSAAVYDMVYSPRATPLVATARLRGHRSADGLGMLAAQGEEAFFLWTGIRPPSGVMKSRILAECVEK